MDKYQDKQEFPRIRFNRSEVRGKGKFSRLLIVLGGGIFLFSLLLNYWLLDQLRERQRLSKKRETQFTEEISEFNHKTKFYRAAAEAALDPSGYTAILNPVLPGAPGKGKIAFEEGEAKAFISLENLPSLPQGASYQLLGIHPSDTTSLLRISEEQLMHVIPFDTFTIGKSPESFLLVKQSEDAGRMPILAGEPVSSAKAKP